jgi:hypothetical protein
MLRTSKAANTRRRSAWRERARPDMTNGTARGPTAALPSRDGDRTDSPIGNGPKARSGTFSPILKDVSSGPQQENGLSVRAENVLKELAAELTGENPQKGRWVPSGALLRVLSFGDRLSARNCGPQTMDEIIRWAKSKGVVIERPFHAGKSLSAMWRDIIARSSTGESTRAEIAEALERSSRRKSTRIPVAIQSLLVKVLKSTDR